MSYFCKVKVYNSELRIIFVNFVSNKTFLLNTGIICHKNQVFLNRLKRPNTPHPNQRREQIKYSEQTIRRTSIITIFAKKKL